MLKTLKALKALAASCICCILIACGGGGGSSTEAVAGSPTDTVNPVDNSNPGYSSDLPTLELSWLIPDTREDGTNLYPYEIAGYHIYYTNSDTPIEEADVITVNDAQTTDYAFTSLPSGNYRLAIAAVDTQGLQSALSEEITARVP